jgi:hypothetical protein
VDLVGPLLLTIPCTIFDMSTKVINIDADIFMMDFVGETITSVGEPLIPTVSPLGLLLFFETTPSEYMVFDDF